MAPGPWQTCYSGGACRAGTPCQPPPSPAHTQLEDTPPGTNVQCMGLAGTLTSACVPHQCADIKLRRQGQPPTCLSASRQGWMGMLMVSCCCGWGPPAAGAAAMEPTLAVQCSVKAMNGSASRTSGWPAWQTLSRREALLKRMLRLPGAGAPAHSPRLWHMLPLIRNGALTGLLRVAADRNSAAGKRAQLGRSPGAPDRGTVTVMVRAGRPSYATLGVAAVLAWPAAAHRLHTCLSEQVRPWGIAQHSGHPLSPGPRWAQAGPTAQLWPLTICSHGTVALSPLWPATSGRGCRPTVCHSYAACSRRAHADHLPILADVQVDLPAGRVCIPAQGCPDLWRHLACHRTASGAGNQLCRLQRLLGCKTVNQAVAGTESGPAAADLTLFSERAWSSSAAGLGAAAGLGGQAGAMQSRRGMGLAAARARRQARPEPVSVKAGHTSSRGPFAGGSTVELGSGHSGHSG